MPYAVDQHDGGGVADEVLPVSMDMTGSLGAHWWVDQSKACVVCHDVLVSRSLGMGYAFTSP